LFSMKVDLQRKNNGKGTLKIDFQNDEELEKIMQVLKL